MAKRINIGPWKSVGDRKFGKKNILRAGKIWQIMCKLVWGKNHTIKKLLCWKNKIQNESKTARWDFLNQVQTCLKDDAKVQACWKNVAIKPN